MAVVLTFDPHPARVLSPGRAKSSLMTLEQKAQVMGGLGVDRLVVLPFTEEIARMSAEEFARQVLRQGLGAEFVVVGEDFRFGRGRSGDVRVLSELGGALAFEVRTVGPVMDEGAPISSSRVRELLGTGEVAKAARLLGRPYYVDGPVVRGAGRGGPLGFATANVAVRNETVPLVGVYACHVDLGDGTGPRPAVSNLGERPTFGGGGTMLEAHLLDFAGDLYGREVRVAFIERIRAERRFSGVPELREQIGVDVRTARRILEMA
jgi:riboflavin kinase/FMN adenylyltransferase